MICLMNFFLFCYSWYTQYEDWDVAIKDVDYCNFMYDASERTQNDIVPWEVVMDEECFTICRQI